MKAATIVYTTVFTLLCFSTLSAQIVNIEERRIKGTNDSTYWYGSVRLGANIVKVQDQILQLNGTAHVQYKKGKSLTLLLLDGNLLRAGDQDFNENAFAHLRYNYKIRDQIILEAFVQAQFNKLQLIELRALAGSGLRFRLLKSKDGKQRMYSGIAYLYEQNQFLEGIPDRSWHRISSYISFTFRPSDGVKIINTTYFQPAFSDFGSYRFSTEWRLDTPITSKLNFFTNFSLTSDRSLPADSQRTTYAWRNGLAYKF
ncbi:MAG: DUF481 domain-containing protein [Bacteroidota bacterium]